MTRVLFDTVFRGESTLAHCCSVFSMLLGKFSEASIRCSPCTYLGDFGKILQMRIYSR